MSRDGQHNSEAIYFILQFTKFGISCTYQPNTRQPSLKHVSNLADEYSVDTFMI